MASANEASAPPTEGYEPTETTSAWAGYQPLALSDDASVILAPDEYRNLNLGYVPQEGDVIFFKSDRHAIYNSLPDGTFILATDSFVDLRNPIHC